MRAIILFFLSVSCLSAADWYDRVDYYYGTQTDHSMYGIYGVGTNGVITLWDLPYPKPPIAVLLGHDEEIDASDDYSEGKKRQKMDGDALRLWAESNIVATAINLGLTNRPVKWTKLSNKIQNVIETNAVEGLKISANVQQWLLFYALNGGDAWKIGKVKQ